MDDAREKALWVEMARQVAAVQALADSVGLPYIAAQSDLADPEPMHDENGNYYAETSFRWLDPDNRYWTNRRLALDDLPTNISRVTAEPFAIYGGALHFWRETSLTDGFDVSNLSSASGTGGSIVTPVHLPGSRFGMVVWAGLDGVDVGAIYRDRAFELQGAAIRLLATHAEASANRAFIPSTAHLTRREVQCLRWAAEGKTDFEIGIILSLSMSTVRFHLRNAATKLGTTGRTQTIRHAAGLGFLSSARGSRSR